jgi:rod shape-determining protein MreD
LCFSAAPQASKFLWGYTPDLLIIIIAYLALRTELYLGVAGAFILGFLHDGLTLSPPGFFPLVLITSVFLIKLLMKIVELNRLIIKIPVVFILFYLIYLVFYPSLMYIYIGSASFMVISHAITAYCIEALITALLAPLFFALFDKVT